MLPGADEAYDIQALDDSGEYLTVESESVDVRVLVIESLQSQQSYTPDSSEGNSGSGSALFDLNTHDMTGMDLLDRGMNPIKPRGDSENYFVIIQEDGDYLAYYHNAETGTMR